MPQPEIILIAAVARNGAIGRGSELLFRDPVDQRHFRDTTMGHPVIMGRKTWDSLPARFRPLPGRRNIVVSRNAALRLEGAEVALSLEAALALAAAVPKVFVIGGAQLYALALPLAHTLEMTKIDADLKGDSYFPAWDRSQFERVASQTHASAQGLRFCINSYHRK